jgi:hypothetical protein
MKRALIVLLLVALLVVVFAFPAFAYPDDWNGKGKAWGAGVKAHCEASYGQLNSAAIQSGHIDKGMGLPQFIGDGLFAAHCFAG